jgi:hypothetical protein
MGFSYKELIQIFIKVLKLKWPALADHIILYNVEFAVLLSTHSIIYQLPIKKRFIDL